MDDYAGIKEHVSKEYLMISTSIDYKVNLEKRGEAAKEKDNSKLHTQLLQDITAEPELRFCR